MCPGSAESSGNGLAREVDVPDRTHSECVVPTLEVCGRSQMLEPGVRQFDPRFPPWSQQDQASPLVTWIGNKALGFTAEQENTICKMWRRGE